MGSVLSMNTCAVVHHKELSTSNQEAQQVKMTCIPCTHVLATSATHLEALADGVQVVVCAPLLAAQQAPLHDLLWTVKEEDEGRLNARLRGQTGSAQGHVRTHKSAGVIDGYLALKVGAVLLIAREACAGTLAHN